MEHSAFRKLFLETINNRENPYHPLVWINGEPEIGLGTYIGGFSELNAKGARLIIGNDCDIDNNTKGILKELEKCKFRNNLKAVVVLGKDSPHINSVVTIARSLSYNVEVKIGVNNMAEIMADSDLAIGASGSTTWERCCLGLPTIQIVTADNQRTIAKLLAKKGAIRFCESVTQVVNFVDNFSDWAPNTSLTAQQVVDGLGVERVVSKVMT